MEVSESERKIEGMEDFSREKGDDLTFDMYRILSDDEEGIKKLGDKCSDFFYISCLPYEEYFDKWKDVPEIYQILKRYEHTAEYRSLKILIGKYKDEYIQKLREITEEKRDEYESKGFIVRDPNPYFYIVGFFGGTSGRNAEAIIDEFRAAYPDKFKEIKSE